MDFGFIVQIIIFAILALALVVIFGAAALAIPRPHKVKAYRYSKSGDDWINRK